MTLLNKSIPLTAALLGVGFIAPAYAVDYTSVALGMTATNDSGFSIIGDNSTTVTGALEFKDTANLALALGWQTGDRTRTEVELSRRTAKALTRNVDGAASVDVENLDAALKTTALMINGYADFETRGKVSPYIGVGLGIVRHDDDTVFAYQASAGISYAMSDENALFVDLRYFRSLDAEYEEGPLTVNLEYRAQELRIGWRSGF